MSTATIYADRYDAANDEATGTIGGNEPGVPGYWAYSVEIAKAWEHEQQSANTPRTRKVAMRTAMVMAPGIACTDWPAGHEMDGRDRRIFSAHRYEAATQEPARGADSAHRSRRPKSQPFARPVIE